MKGNEYQKKVLRTVNYNLSYDEQLYNYCIGVIGEFGELFNRIKKWKFHDKNLDYNYVIEEIGDVLWYITALCDLLNISLNKVMKKNIKKLKKRYPNGFRAFNGEYNEPAQNINSFLKED